MDRKIRREREDLGALVVATQRHIAEVRHVLWLIRETTTTAEVVSILRKREDALSASLDSVRAALAEEAR